MRILSVLLTLFLVSQSNAASSVKIVTDLFEDGELIQRIGYFTDSAEFGTRLFPRYCYSGAAKQVCALLEVQALDSQNETRHGAQEYFELLACTQVGNSFEVEYNLYSPEGTFNKTAMIRSCR